MKPLISGHSLQRLLEGHWGEIEKPCRLRLRVDVQIHGLAMRWIERGLWAHTYTQVVEELMRHIQSQFLFTTPREIEDTNSEALCTGFWALGWPSFTLLD